MTLRDAAIRLTNQQQPVFVPESLSVVSKTGKREVEIAERFGLGGRLREPPDLSKIQLRLIGKLSNQRMDEIARRDLRYAPQCIWHEESPIARQPENLERLLRFLEKTGRRTVVRTLAAVYFRYFHQRRAGIDLVGRALSRMVSAELTSLYQFSEDFDVFNPVEGPKRIAGYCLERDITPLTLLRQYGLSGEALTSGFGIAVFRVGMSGIASRLRDDRPLSQVARAIAWVNEPRPARYRGGAVTLAKTLLLPFWVEDPAEDVKNRILEVLLERIGDPRTRPERWQNMEDAAEIARRWLTRLALVQFLEIVDQVAYPQHWDYRRAFWTALFEKDAISQAWVAFGRLGAERATRDYGETIKFGRLVASWKPIESGHAVLVMRIGDYVAIDWSQNGRCVFWPVGHPDAPGLYQDEYYSGDIAPRVAPRGGIEVTHSHSDTFVWQRKIADFIHRNTGFDLRDRDYRIT